MRDKLKSKIQFKKFYCCGSEEGIELHHFKYKNFLDGASSKNIAPTCRICHQEIHDLSRLKNISFARAAKRIRKKNGYRITYYSKVKKEKNFTKKEPIIKTKLKHYIILGDGEKCPKCSKFMQRRKRRVLPEEKGQIYYLEWDYCRPCRHVQHYSDLMRVS